MLIQLLVWVGAWAGSWYGIAKFLKSKGKPGWLGHLAGGVLGLLISLALLGSILPAPQDRASHAMATADVSPAPAQIEAQVLPVSAGQLFKAYHANEVSADVKYKGKVLAISGTVAGITKDLFDNVSVELRTANEFMPARAQLEDSEHAKAAVLQRGRHVTLICTGEGMLIGSPMLDSCRIQ